MSASWSQNRARQPNAAMIGEPSETPITGPPAPMSDHHPMALTLSWGVKTLKIRAAEAVPVAAPCTPSSALAKSSMSTLCESAVRIAETIAPLSPKR